MEELQTHCQAGESVFPQQRIGQPGGDLQVLGSLFQRVGRQGDDLREIGDLTFGLPGSLVQIVVFAARFLDGVVDRIVTEVRAGRIVACEWAAGVRRPA